MHVPKQVGKNGKPTLYPLRLLDSTCIRQLVTRYHGVAQSKWGIPVLLPPRYRRSKRKRNHAFRSPRKQRKTKEKYSLEGWTWPFVLLTALTDIRPHLLIRGLKPASSISSSTKSDPPTSSTRPGIMPTLVLSKNSSTAGRCSRVSEKKAN